jgi:hypothetical protein
MVIEQKKVDWEAGDQAGVTGKSYICPAGI